MSRKGRRKEHRATTISMGVIVLAFLVVMSIQIYKLNEKDKMYEEREQNLLEQLAEEESRAEELKEMDLYTKSVEYIKDMANKLGLVFENEIIFRESGE